MPKSKQLKQKEAKERKLSNMPRHEKHLRDLLICADTQNKAEADYYAGLVEKQRALIERLNKECSTL